MLQVFAGTVLLAMVLIAVSAWALIYAMGALEDHGADETAVSIDGRTPGRLADHVGWQDQRTLHALSQDQQRRLAERRREAAEAALFRICKSASTTQGHRDPNQAA